MKLSTFSLVARDPQSGCLAVGGGTNWFCYGRWVPHVQAGVGVLATQAETNMWYGENGLKSLQVSNNAEGTVKDMLQKDPDKSGVYQLLIMDNQGRTACHTGKNCHDYAGHFCQQDLGVAGNTLVSEETLIKMLDFYRKSDLPLALRVIRSLRIGQQAGGDIRGMKSAAIKVVKGSSSGKYWNDILYDLRVDENSDPLKELERLYYVTEAYHLIDRAESTGDIKEKEQSYQKALKLDPNNAEIIFWLARLYDGQDKKQEAEKLKLHLKSFSGHWLEYWQRLDKRKE